MLGLIPPAVKGLVYRLVQHPLTLWVVLLGLSLALLRLAAVRASLTGFLRRHGALTFATLAAGILLLYFAVIGWYLSLPAFADDVEPMIASVSWIVHQGHPLYHGLDSPERYSALYGPIVYLSNGLFLDALGPSVFSAKLGGGVAALLSAVFLFLVLARTVSRRLAFYYCAFAALLYFVCGPFSYVSRPDPLVLASVSFGLLSTLRARRVLAVLGVAVALALSANLKLHTVLFFLPVLVLLAQRFGPGAAVLTSLLSAVLVLLPFALSSRISLVNYVLWLREATRHGLDLGRLPGTLRFAAFFFLPAVVLAVPPRTVGRVLREQRAYIGSLVVATLLLAVFATKPGASMTHLMPVVPLVLYLSALLLREHQRARPGWEALLEPARLGTLLACFAATFFVGSVVEYKFVQRIHVRSESAGEVLRDLAWIQRTHPDDTIAMACGGEGVDYEIVFCRPSLVFAGHPLLVDVISVMESHRSGRPLPPETYEALTSGRVTLWLVPKGKTPFDKRNWYPPHEPVFPEDFIQLVKERYHLVGQSEFFDLWKWATPSDRDARLTLHP